MKKILITAVLFLLGNILLIGVHWYTFTFIAPAVAALTSLLHIILLIFLPYTKLFSNEESI